MLITRCIIYSTVIATIAICLFPLWPYNIREYVWYLSVIAAALVGSILVLAVCKFFFYNHHRTFVFPIKLWPYFSELKKFLKRGITKCWGIKSVLDSGLHAVDCGFRILFTGTWGAIHSTKIPTGPTGKSGPPQKVDQFFRNFSGWTEPIH